MHHTQFVLHTLEQALSNRKPSADDGPVHHSDRVGAAPVDSQQRAVGRVRTEPSVRSKCDSHDNALAETIDGLYKAEVLRRCGPWKTNQAVELLALDGVAWFNHHRLMGLMGYAPPTEFEVNYHRQHAGQTATLWSEPAGHRDT